VPRFEIIITYCYVYLILFVWYVVFYTFISTHRYPLECFNAIIKEPIIQLTTPVSFFLAIHRSFGENLCMVFSQYMSHPIPVG